MSDQEYGMIVERRWYAMATVVTVAVALFGTKLMMEIALGIYAVMWNLILFGITNLISEVRKCG